MQLSLTPVIELGYYNQGNPMPPFKEKTAFSKCWINYRTECFKLGGMPLPTAPTHAGTDFFDISVFTGKNLDWLIDQHIRDYINSDPEQICPFFGGYILSNNDEALLYPQCCGDLSDIHWWKHICYDMKNVYYNGHPCPILNFKDREIEFQCIDEYDPFDELTKTKFIINQQELIKAYDSVIPKLLEFRNKIIDALKSHNYSIPNEELADQLTINNVELAETHL